MTRCVHAGLLHCPHCAHAHKNAAVADLCLQCGGCVGHGSPQHLRRVLHKHSPAPLLCAPCGHDRSAALPGSSTRIAAPRSWPSSSVLTRTEEELRALSGHSLGRRVGERGCMAAPYACQPLALCASAGPRAGCLHPHTGRAHALAFREASNTHTSCATAILSSWQPVGCEPARAVLTHSGAAGLHWPQQANTIQRFAQVSCKAPPRALSPGTDWPLRGPTARGRACG